MARKSFRHECSQRAAQRHQYCRKSGSARHRNLTATLRVATQLGFAVGFVLLVPLGDRIDRRRLILLQMTALTLSLVAAALAPDAWALVVISALVGITSSVAQQIVPFAAELAEPSRRGGNEWPFHCDARHSRWDEAWLLQVSIHLREGGNLWLPPPSKAIFRLSRPHCLALSADCCIGSTTPSARKNCIGSRQIARTE